MDSTPSFWRKIHIDGNYEYKGIASPSVRFHKSKRLSLHISVMQGALEDPPPDLPLARPTRSADSFYLSWAHMTRHLDRIQVLDIRFRNRSSAQTMLPLPGPLPQLFDLSLYDAVEVCDVLGPDNTASLKSIRVMTLEPFDRDSLFSIRSDNLEFFELAAILPVGREALEFISNSPKLRTLILRAGGGEASADEPRLSMTSPLLGTAVIGVHIFSWLSSWDAPQLEALLLFGTFSNFPKQTIPFPSLLRLDLSVSLRPLDVHGTVTDMYSFVNMLSSMPFLQDITVGSAAWLLIAVLQIPLRSAHHRNHTTPLEGGTEASEALLCPQLRSVHVRYTGKAEDAFPRSMLSIRGFAEVRKDVNVRLSLMGNESDIDKLSAHKIGEDYPERVIGEDNVIPHLTE